MGEREYYYNEMGQRSYSAWRERPAVRIGRHVIFSDGYTCRISLFVYLLVKCGCKISVRRFL